MEQLRTLAKIKVKPPNIFSLMVLSAFASMGAVLMMPALPEISHHFEVHEKTAQLVVTFFLLGYAFGMLLYGPLANRFGRKFALYIGIGIASLGSALSIVASPFESFTLLVFGRFLEAVGACAGLSVSIAIINDYYYTKDARRVLGLLMLAFAIIPGVAVTLGGMLTQYTGWESCFYFLFLYGLMLLFPTHRLAETNLTPNINALKRKHILKNYLHQFKIKKLVGFAIISGLSTACVYVFGTEGPFIGIQLLDMKPATYGFVALTPYIGTLCGSLAVVRLAAKDPIYVLKIAFMFELIASILMFIFFYFNIINLKAMLIPMALFCVGHPIIAATVVSLALEKTRDKSNGSAVVNFIAMFVPVFMTLALSVFQTVNPIIMPVIFIICLIIMVGCYWYYIKN